MANKKSTASFEAGSWYHRIKILQKDGTTKYSKKGGFATAKEAEASYHKYEEEYKSNFRFIGRKIWYGFQVFPGS